MIDTSGIQRVIRQARRRLRVQAAMEVATTTSIVAFATALVSVYLVRTETIAGGTGLLLAIAAGVSILVGGVAGWLRRPTEQVVATRIDRASGLSDRLASACAFEKKLRDPAGIPDETVDMMRAAVRDATRCVARADVKAAAPYRRPAELRNALSVGLVCLAIAGLTWHIHKDVELSTHGTITLAGQALPDEEGPRGTILITNTRTKKVRTIDLGTKGPLTYEAVLVTGSYIIDFEANPDLCADSGKTEEADAAAKTPSAERDDTRRRMPCTGGPIASGVFIDAHQTKKETTYFVDCETVTCKLDIDIPLSVGRPPVPVAFNEDDLDYTKQLLDDLRQTAKDAGDVDLEKFVKEIEALLRKAQRGEISKEQLLDKLAKAEKKYQQGAKENIKETISDLKQTGIELKKNKDTKELGKALEKGDLDKAKKEMQKLAKKLDDNKLSPKQRQKIAKALEKAATKFDKRQKNRDAKMDRQIQKAQRRLKRLEKQQKQAKTDRERRRIARRAKEQKRRLKKLQRKKQQRQQSAHRRRLKRLHRNLRESAKNMRKPGQKNRRMASRRMRDAANDTGKVQQDMRKVRNQKKVASQLTDLKEAMRRARRRQGRGQKDLFGRNKRNKDFGRRSRGGRGNKGAWKPGGKGGRLGKGGRAGQGNKPGGQGNKPGGKSYGTGDGGDPMGDPTGKGGHVTDRSVSGVHGKGPSTRETVLSAAQKGFASRAYQKVFTKYKRVVEDVMQTEKVPSGYKYYIKKYFQKIKPHAM